MAPFIYASARYSLNQYVTNTPNKMALLVKVMPVEGRKPFPFFPSRIFGWLNNYIDVRQTNRRKTDLYVGEPHKHMCLGEAPQQSGS